jgi:hypothetical protein
MTVEIPHCTGYPSPLYTERKKPSKLYILAMRILQGPFMGLQSATKCAYYLFSYSAIPIFSGASLLGGVGIPIDFGNIFSISAIALAIIYGSGTAIGIILGISKGIHDALGFTSGFCSSWSGNFLCFELKNPSIEPNAPSYYAPHQADGSA